MLVSVVMPVYNEMRTLSSALRRLTAADFEKEIVIVDDGSKDGSREWLEKLRREGLAVIDDVSPRNINRVKVLFQPHNQGKGAAIRRGFEEVSGDIIIIQDADLEYDPGEIPRVVQPIVDDVADVVFGSRFSGSPHRVLYYWHALGNHFLTTLSNMSTGLNLTDMETCYKAMSRKVLESFKLEENRFGVEPELTAKIARGRFRVYEVAISYYGRTYEEGKKIGWKDGVRALYVISKYAVLNRVRA